VPPEDIPGHCGSENGEIENRPHAGGSTSSTSDAALVGEMCSIILTTSPTPSNPSTELIEETLRSMGAYAPELLQCQMIIVCDGHKAGSTSKFRCGVVTEERAQAYSEYLDNLQALVDAPREECWKKVKLLKLTERHGFGFAVRAALPMVTTPFVCIMQHDRTFMRPCSFVLQLLKAMEKDERLKMVGMPTTTNNPSHYIKAAESKMGEIKVPQPRPKMEEACVRSDEIPGVRFIPMIMWHDSTHFASTSYYRSFVFGPRNLVSRGGFIEDKLGQQQGLDLRTKGWETHADYGTWLLDDFAPQPARLVGHLDGKHFLRTEDKAAIQAQQRAAKASVEEKRDNQVQNEVPSSEGNAAKSVECRHDDELSTSLDSYVQSKLA